MKKYDALPEVREKKRAQAKAYYQKHKEDVLFKKLRKKNEYRRRNPIIRKHSPQSIRANDLKRKRAYRLRHREEIRVNQQERDRSPRNLNRMRRLKKVVEFRADILSCWLCGIIHGRSRRAKYCLHCYKKVHSYSNHHHCSAQQAVIALGGTWYKFKDESKL